MTEPKQPEDMTAEEARDVIRYFMAVNRAGWNAMSMWCLALAFPFDEPRPDIDNLIAAGPDDLERNKHLVLPQNMVHYERALYCKEQFVSDNAPFIHKQLEEPGFEWLKNAVDA